MSNIQRLNPPLWVTDAVGNVTGQLGPDGQATQLFPGSGAATLATGAGTTTVTVTNLLATQKVVISPASAAAANLLRTTQCPYVSSVSAGSFVISTADGTNAGAGCIFNYVVL